MAIETKKTKVKTNKLIYLGISILDISKTLMYEFQYDYIKRKYQDKAKLCYMDTDSFAIYIKTEYFYRDIANDIKKWFNTSNYNKDDNRPLPIGLNKKIIGLFKDKLGGEIMKKFVGVRAIAWAYLMDDDTGHKKAIGTKKMCKKYKDCLFNDKIKLKSQQRFKSDCHNIYAEQIKNTSLSSNDDK